MDSTVLLYKLAAEGDEVKTLSIDYGQRHAKEIDYARSLSEGLGVEHRVADLRSLTELQSTLIERASACVRPGGRLIWSTCSLSPTENEQRVALFLSEHPGWSLAAEAGHLPGSPGGAGPVDGGYAARLLAP